MSNIFDALQRAESEGPDGQEFHSHSCHRTAGGCRAEAARLRRHARTAGQPCERGFRRFPPIGSAGRSGSMSRSARLDPRGQPLGIVGQRGKLGSREVSFLGGAVAAASTKPSSEKSPDHQHHPCRKGRARSLPTWHALWHEGNRKRLCCWKAICGGRILRRNLA